MKKSSLILIFPLLFLFITCSTDFDINADWKDIAVVYSLLDPTAPTQYVKLNKAFLGDADAYIMAQESDSLYYPEAEVFLEPLNDTAHVYDNYGKVVRFKLEETTDIQKDSGIFAFDYNKIYYTNEPISDYDNYGLVIKIPGKEKISSTTTLVTDLSVTKPTSWDKVSLATTTGYLSYRVEWKTNEVAEIYNLTLRFHYREISPTLEVSDHYVDWAQPSKRKFGTDKELELDISGKAFYQFVASAIAPGIEGTKRKALYIDFMFTLAGKELASYIDVNGPSEGIIQEKPSFTNINNGIGVFSSLFTKTVPKVDLTSLTVDMLSCGEITSHLRFADYNGNYDCLNGK
ncbi:MAG: hypothetical protein K9H64_01930 [Bacteroidales bacterium]|nr:hypothetical protein [Bacteroidales bacterium]MCF8454695.1 hypothetical protein [Bacteroidales bacterium]